MLAKLTDVLLTAKKEKYAVGLFNTANLEMARGVIQEAEALRSPVIVSTAEVLLSRTPLENMADLLIPMAKRACVPVVVHYDHGLTFEKCMEALKLGFSSIMYDCSSDPYEENVRNVREITGIAHAFSAAVEAELGSLDGASGEEPSRFYTDPAQAGDFVRRTRADALAVAVGTAHGAYRLPPKLDFDRIGAIAAAAPVPLVLHGGSGLSDDDFRRAIREGICKVNIFTDLDLAAAAGAREALEAGKNRLTDILPYEVRSARAVVKEKILLFGSAGKA